MSNDTYQFHTYRYWLMTVDPVHIGTGGSRLGRVDNSIVREPGTKLPKIPGTSLSGAIRQYAAAQNNDLNCAGQKNHHTENDENEKCPVCYTFGVANDAGAGYSGVVSIGDARLLLFPVYSMQGPVWVTSARTLADVGIKVDTPPQAAQADFAADVQGNHVNLSWVMVTKHNNLSVTWPEAIPPSVRSRVVLVSENLFAQVVNAGLEVRTSVSINPETGAAEDGALFTYEAIPRAAFLWTEIVEDDFRLNFPAEEKPEWTSPIQVVEAGLNWAEHLGVGGMGTRGFGRLRKIGRQEVA